MEGPDNEWITRRDSINTHEYPFSAHLAYSALTATWRRISSCTEDAAVEYGVSTSTTWSIRGVLATRKRWERCESRNRTRGEHVKGETTITTTLTMPSCCTRRIASYFEETMMRLFPPGSTVVDRGSGSLTAQASLSIDSYSPRVAYSRRAPHDTPSFSR